MFFFLIIESKKDVDSAKHFLIIFFFFFFDKVDSAKLVHVNDINCEEDLAKLVSF